MQVWRDGTGGVPADAGRTVVTIGVFDGVHRGHQRIVHRALARAAELRLPGVAVTFEPMPEHVVRPARQAGAADDPSAPPRAARRARPRRYLRHRLHQGVLGTLARRVRAVGAGRQAARRRHRGRCELSIRTPSSGRRRDARRNRELGRVHGRPDPARRADLRTRQRRGVEGVLVELDSRADLGRRRRGRGRCPRSPVPVRGHCHRRRPSGPRAGLPDRQPRGGTRSCDPGRRGLCRPAERNAGGDIDWYQPHVWGDDAGGSRPT